MKHTGQAFERENSNDKDGSARMGLLSVMSGAPGHSRALSGGGHVQSVSHACAMTTSSEAIEIMAAKSFIWLGHIYVMSMIQKIQAESVPRQWLDSLQRPKIPSVTVTFFFIPGHAGVQDNERSDRLAGLATFDDGQPMDREDIVKALRELGREEDFGGGDLASLSRMHELRVRARQGRSGVPGA